MRMMNYLMLTVLVTGLLGCQKDSIKVIENQEDGTITIEGITWTLNNLDIIPAGYEDQVWWYDNDSATYFKYGRLYTWQAAKAACEALAEGWNLPTYQEWESIIELSGGYTRASTALVEGGTLGLDLQLAGHRLFVDGSYWHFGYYGLYWSGTERPGWTEWAYNLHLPQSGLDNTELPSTRKMEGYSCRCIKAN